MNATPGPGSAAVAAQLLDFLREPARFRPAWLHGERPLPEGHVVLKFALGRFSPGWNRDLSPHDKQALVEAAKAFVRQVCLWERATHYQVLCLEPGSGVESVRENYRLLMALLHPDRQDEGSEPEWPTGCAQRVNEAYAVLSDPERRRQYDTAAHHGHVAHEVELELPPDLAVARVRRRPTHLRAFALVSGVMVALFLLQAWWVTDTPRHYALLERSLAGHTTGSWMREVISDGLPRFLEAKPAVSLDPIALLEPPKAPRRMVAWVPASDVRTTVANAPAPEAAPRDSAPTEAVPPRYSVLPPTPRASSSPSTMPAAAAAPLVVAQAAPMATPGSTGGSSTSAQEIELLVARLVSHYEQGDADGLMALFASGEPGFWKGYRVRSAYADFFRATRVRQLRMNRLEWQTSGDTARARGEATLIADYVDGSGHVERMIPVELDIALRDGRAGITRLNLYPEPK